LEYHKSNKKERFTKDGNECYETKERSRVLGKNFLQRLLLRAGFVDMYVHVADIGDNAFL